VCCHGQRALVPPRRHRERLFQLGERAGQLTSRTVLIYASGVLTVVALLSRALNRSWITPTTVLPAFWAVLLDWAWITHYAVGTSAIWAIVLLVTSFSIGSAVRQIGREATVPTQRLIGVDLLDRLRKWNNWLNVIGVIGVVLVVVEGLHRYGLASSPAGLRQLGHSYSLARYGGGGTVSSSLSLVAAIPFAGSAVALFRWSFTYPRRRRVWLLVSPALVAVYAYSTAEHAQLLFGAAFAIGGFLAASAWRRPISKTISLSSMVVVVIGILVIPLALSYLTNDRSGYARTTSSNNRRADLYIVGSLPAFSTWYDAGNHGEGWGANSFAGPASLVHLRSRTQGLYDQSVEIAGTANNSGVNVYTAFRPLIADFTLPGAAIIMFLIGAWATHLFAKVAFAYKPSAWGALVGVYAAIFVSSTVSIFAYNNVTLDVVLVVLIALTGRSKASAINTRHTPGKAPPIRDAATTKHDLSPSPCQ
jgi:oligosaccharide repeat unit polymerase